MTSKTTTDFSTQVLTHGDNAITDPLVGSLEHQGSRNRNQVLKSGPLFISSKGIGWTSWKKRWFILTRTSLVFYRNDPSVAPQKGGHVNLTLGGIDLNSSASVEVKVDKKLLTVFFPDSRDGRAFTLKAETLEDLDEWKTALENALKLAPIATHVPGQNGLLKNEQADFANGSADQQKDKPPVKSMVIGRPILLALEDVDGSPSFLEKALRFIEDHGVKVEGILRQAADVDDVHRRVREYEHGKTDFSPKEDAHVIADCIKYILRELPSSPVPASCCNALLEALRTDRNNRPNAMRTAILETFPEPNRRLLQRILLMMQTVASNNKVNRMSTSGVAACMSPLLLRPLLAGDCELEDTHMDVAGDGCFQLLQAAAAANHAQAIIITLLEEYDNIFGEGSMAGDLFSDSDESGTGTEEVTDDDMYDDDDDDYDDNDEHEYASDDDEEETDDGYEHSVTETCSESPEHSESDSSGEKHSRSSSFSRSRERVNNKIPKQKSSSVSPRAPITQHDDRRRSDDNTSRTNDRSVAEIDDILKSRRNNTAKNNLAMESIDFEHEDEDDEIHRLEAMKTELQNKITEEANGNAVLQASLQRRKKALHERRLALEKDVNMLQEQLQKEKNLRAALEAASNISQFPSMTGISEKTKKELQEISIAEKNFNNLKQRVDDLGVELSDQRDHNAALMHNRIYEIQDSSSQWTKPTNKKDNMTRSSEYAERSCKDDRNYSVESVDGSDCEKEWKNEPSTEVSASKPISSTSGKSSKSQGGRATTSDQSRITNRLNTLKERRNQIANELQYIDSNKVSSNQPALSPGKGKATDFPITHGTDKNQNDQNHNRMSTEGDNNDNDKKRGAKTSSNPRLDAQSQYSPRKGVSNKGDRNEGENKDRNKKGSTSRSDVTLSNRSVKVKSTEGDNNEYNKKNEKRDGQEKGFSLKTDTCTSENFEQGRKSEYQSSQHLDRVKSEAQSSRSYDKGRR